MTEPTNRAAAMQAAPQHEGRFPRAGVFATAAAIAVYVILRLQGLLDFSLWGAEAFLLIGARMGWSDMFAYIVADLVHPPLPYVLFKLWIMIGGESLLWLKLFPVTTAVAAIVPLMLMCRELRLSRFETNLILTLAAVNGYLIHYAQEVRMYSLFMFLAVCSGWLFVRYFNAAGAARRELAPLTAANLLLVYTHFYGWLVIAIQLLALLLWDRKRLAWLAASVAAVVVLFLPWAIVILQELARQGSPFHFIPSPTAYLIAYLYANFNGPLKVAGTIRPGLLLFGIPILWWFVRVAIGRAAPGERRIFWWLAGCAFLPNLIVLGLGRLLNDSFWWDRYFIFMAPFYLTLVAAAVYRLRPAPLRAAYAGALVAWAAVAGDSDLTTQRMAWITPQVGSRLHWERAASVLAAATADSVKVYVLPLWTHGQATGQWAIYGSMAFYMDPPDRERIHFRALGYEGQLLNMPVGSDFWVAAFNVGEAGDPIPVEPLREMGYSVVERLRVGDPRRALLMAHLVQSDSGEAPQERAGSGAPDDDGR